MNQITTHILDTSNGKPAGKVKVRLEKRTQEDGWNFIAEGITNSEGRVKELLDEKTILKEGIYRMTFFTEEYFRNKNVKTFYPNVQINFVIDSNEHYHIPLLISPFGYSTYRGS